MPYSPDRNAMKILCTLKNNNQICREVSHQAHVPAQTSNFSMKTVFSGNARCDIGKKQLNLYPGTFIAINDGTTFASRPESFEPVSTLSITFSRPFLEDFVYSRRASHRQLIDEPIGKNSNSGFFLETIYPCTGDMKYNMVHLKNHIESGDHDDLLLNEYLHHSLINYYRTYHKELSDTSDKLQFLSRPTRIEILRRLTLAREYIFSNYNQKIGLEDIAARACLSVNHLLRTFKQAFGRSPHQYLTSVRLEHSKYLLQHSSYPVNEIVSIVGFECPSSFIRLFKKVYHVTPGQFR